MDESTEFRLDFYYRGGEVFEFEGDDDLWVFIDGKLTDCDLGGLHPPSTCSINLDSLSLTPDTVYNMAVFRKPAEDQALPS